MMLLVMRPLLVLVLVLVPMPVLVQVRVQVQVLAAWVVEAAAGQLCLRPQMM